MGLDGYYSTGNKNSAGQIIETTIDASPFQNTGIRGPKIDYYNIGYVGWYGLNSMVEYKMTDLPLFFKVVVSNQTFQREDLFDQPTLPLSEKVSVGGGYLKGGANFNIDSRNNVFFNAGTISRQPNFDGVFPNFANLKNEDLQNEQINSVEVGYGFLGPQVRLNVNAYSTVWGNRFVSRSLTNSQGVDGFAQFKDIDVRHNGIEVEGDYQPTNALKVSGMLSVGDWRYTKDFEAELFDENQQSIGTGTLYKRCKSRRCSTTYCIYCG
jgi:outer membrane receptor protein involved in Fe transport